MMEKETYDRIKQAYKSVETEIADIAMKNGGHTEFTQGMMYALDLFKQSMKKEPENED